MEETRGKARITKRVTYPETLVVGDGTFTYLVLGLSTDAAFAGIAKEILARRTTPRTLDPYFERKGLLFGGQLTSLVGAFAAHEVALKANPNIVPSERVALSDDLEKDIAWKRLVIPFALTAERRSSGGVLTFDVRGETAAWTSVGEHVFSGLGGLLLLSFLLATMSP